MPSEKQLLRLANQAYTEFENAGDYIWKSPRLLEHERRIELDKLDAYFPNAEVDSDSATLRDLRWTLESDKLDNVFPYLIAVGNLVALVSLFETYCLRVCVEVHKLLGAPLPGTIPHGLLDLFKLMKARGVDPALVPLHEQVIAATKIRNCLAHSSGLLDWSRKQHELRQIHAEGTHLSLEHREKRATSGLVKDILTIVRTPLGDRMLVDNDYPFLLSNYFQKYICDLCERFAELGSQVAAGGK